MPHLQEMNPFIGLFQLLCLDFECLLSSFGIQLTPFTDTSLSEKVIRNPGKIGKTSYEEVQFKTVERFQLLLTKDKLHQLKNHPRKHVPSFSIP